MANFSLDIFYESGKKLNSKHVSWSNIEADSLLVVEVVVGSGLVVESLDPAGQAGVVLQAGVGGTGNEIE